MTLEAVSPSGDELLPFEDGVGESVTVGQTRFVAPGDGNLNKMGELLIRNYIQSYIKVVK